MAFPILGLIFAGGVGFKLHRRNAQANKFAEHFKSLGYNESQAKHLGFVAHDQGIAAAANMHNARRAYELRTNPSAAIAAHNADLSNPNVFVETPNGPMLSPRQGTAQWVEDNQQTEDMIQHRNLVLEYRDMIANEGRWRGRNPKAAELDAMQQILKVGYAKSLGGPVTESDLAASDALFGAEMANAILQGETNEELVAGINVYLEQQGQDMMQQLNNVYWQQGHERDRGRYDAVVSEIQQDSDELRAQARAAMQDAQAQTSARALGMRQAATEALANQPGFVGDVIQSLMLGGQAMGLNPNNEVEGLYRSFTQAQKPIATDILPQQGDDLWTVLRKLQSLGAMGGLGGAAQPPQ